MDVVPWCYSSTARMGWDWISGKGVKYDANNIKGIKREIFPNLGNIHFVIFIWLLVRL